MVGVQNFIQLCLALLQHSQRPLPGQFFRLWDKIETAYLGGTDCVIQDGRYSRRLRLPEGLSDREQGAVLAGYIRAMERGLKAFFNSLEDPHQAAAAVERAYQEYLRQYPAI